MELKVTTLDGKDAGTVTVSDEIFGLEPRADILHRMVRYQLAKRSRPARTRPRPRRDRAPARRCTSRRARRRPSRRPSAPQFRGGGKAFGPVVRSHAHRPAQEGPRAGPEACAVGQGQGRRADRRRQRARPSQDQGAARPASASSA
jgi:hypothetical protein